MTQQKKNFRIPLDKLRESPAKGVFLAKKDWDSYLFGTIVGCVVFILLTLRRRKK